MAEQDEPCGSIQFLQATAVQHNTPIRHAQSQLPKSARDGGEIRQLPGSLQVKHAYAVRNLMLDPWHMGIVISVHRDVLMRQYTTTYQKRCLRLL